MRVSKVLKAICGFGRETVVMGTHLVREGRPRLEVHVRSKIRRRGECGRCGEPSSWLDNGGGVRQWRHLDAGYATVVLVAVARRARDG